MVIATPEAKALPVNPAGVADAVLVLLLAAVLGVLLAFELVVLWELDEPQPATRVTAIATVVILTADARPARGAIGGNVLMVGGVL